MVERNATKHKRTRVTLGEVRNQESAQFVEAQVESLAAEFSSFEISPDQIDAWRTLCEWLHDASQKVPKEYDSIGCFFEFQPPMKSERSDLMLVGDRELLVIEAKTGQAHKITQARKQALNYAIQIYSSLEVGSERLVTPIVLQENKFKGQNPKPKALAGFSYERRDVAVISASELATLIKSMTAPSLGLDLLDTTGWVHKPRASVVELAREMFGTLRSGGITKSLADNDELERLVTRIRELIHQARANSEHRVVAVTGRPGSGKTLVGLRIAHQVGFLGDVEVGASAPIFLSGNEPLVEVLRHAISSGRSDAAKKRKSGKELMKIRKDLHPEREIVLHISKLTDLEVSASIIVFDEAQRAWTAKHNQKSKQSQDLRSQPYVVLEKMTKKPWSVVICIVGSGQHINPGEEGMNTWYDAIEEINKVQPEVTKPVKWRITVPRGEEREGPDIEFSDDLELTVDMRAGSTQMNEWVNLLLDNQIDEALVCRASFPNYPLLVSRDLEICKQWLKQQTNLSHGETAGLVVSSKNRRLGVYGLTWPQQTRDFDAVSWFTNKYPHLKACSSFEIAATEYGCQGLELDRVGACWSWDLVPSSSGWKSRELNLERRKWRELQSDNLKSEYLRNAYRVLLTRSRLGMVIWIPKGDNQDPSRDPDEADEIFEVLCRAGCTPLLERPPR